MEADLSSLSIRRAEAGDAERLTEVAHSAKRYWGYPAHWIELWRNQLTIEPAYIAANEVYLAELQGSIVGLYALGGEGAILVLDHLWVDPPVLGRGIGRTLLQHALALAASKGAQAIEIEADPNAEEFYRRMGARCVGQVTYELEGEPRFLPLLLLAVDESQRAPALR